MTPNEQAKKQFELRLDLDGQSIGLYDGEKGFSLIKKRL